MKNAYVFCIERHKLTICFKQKTFPLLGILLLITPNMFPILSLLHQKAFPKQICSQPTIAKEQQHESLLVIQHFVIKWVSTSERILAIRKINVISIFLVPCLKAETIALSYSSFSLFICRSTKHSSVRQTKNNFNCIILSLFLSILCGFKFKSFSSIYYPKA